MFCIFHHFLAFETSFFTPVRAAPAGTKVSFFTPKNGRKNAEKTPVFGGVKTKVYSVKNSKKIVKK